MDPIQAPAKTETTVYATLTRNGESKTVIVGGGTKLQRVLSALAILRWNREGRKLYGAEFPADAPVSIRQVNWRSVLQKGNV